MPVPRARHGHAAALGGRNPRVCVRTHTTSRAVPCLTAPSLATPPPRRAMHAPARTHHAAALACAPSHVPRARPPRHDPATALPCAVTTHRRRDITSTSRPGQCGLSSNTSWAHATHTHTWSRTQDRMGPSRTGFGRHTRSIERLIGRPRLSGEARSTAPRPICQRERGRGVDRGLAC
jgi:hypothetical protein